MSQQHAVDPGRVIPCQGRANQGSAGVVVRPPATAAVDEDRRAGCAAHEDRLAHARVQHGQLDPLPKDGQLPSDRGKRHEQQAQAEKGQGLPSRPRCRRQNAPGDEHDPVPEDLQPRRAQHDRGPQQARPVEGAQAVVEGLHPKRRQKEAGFGGGRGQNRHDQAQEGQGQHGEAEDWQPQQVEPDVGGQLGKIENLRRQDEQVGADAHGGQQRQGAKRARARPAARARR